MDSDDKAQSAPVKAETLDEYRLLRDFRKLPEEEQKQVLETFEMLAAPQMDDEEYIRIQQGLEYLIGKEKRIAFENQVFMDQRDNPIFWLAVEKQSRADINEVEMLLGERDGGVVELFHPENDGINARSSLSSMVDEFIRINEGETYEEWFTSLTTLRDGLLAQAEKLSKVLNEKTRD